MLIIENQNYEAMSKKAAEHIIERVKQNPFLNLGLATGGTPQRMYEYLVEDYRKNGSDYQNVKCYNLDEYVGVSKDNKNSYYHYMKKNLYGHINIKEENTFIPNGMAKCLEHECREYEEKLTLSGGIDLQILGIGENGHIGFNEPGTPFNASTHIVQLDSSTRKANSRYFSTVEEVPTHAITMGLHSIMKSKEILLLVSGENKAEAFKQLTSGKITTDFPASILQNHKNVKVMECLGLNE
ncbi:glucosamine-6-phosphate deaminase [Sutcliffiella deserti]|uniref:glucosamine-6-phosphate deaminase n=1 Tax=Sutcliffiella deserti TaxID=2875501 RepID=UPI001CBFF586|nr:glucosamine-6-phosphate deaminase [Sutcliffiella deserti]